MLCAGGGEELSSTDPPELPAAADASTTPTAPAATASISVATPAVAEAAAAAVDKPRSSFTSWKQHQGFETTSPWCRLLTESTQGPGSQCDSVFYKALPGKSFPLNVTLHDRRLMRKLIGRVTPTNAFMNRDDKPVAVLESRGSKGCVQVNGKTIKKNISCDLNSGDEVIFQQLPYDSIIKTPPPDVQTNAGKLVHVERRAGDASAVAGASILASLSNLRQDLSRLKPSSQTSESLKFEGSKMMERQNEHFSAFMRNHIKWESFGSEQFLSVDVKLNLVLEIYTRPFTLLPVSAVEGPGKKVMQTLLDRG
ncbi:hypothetical protein PHJA_002816000 [Phtheirospermum japonicum]|uniref:FHA domain-containing protein n=1 Tax=Phtheirospermum japonicum TaxID=374723 RepID=A0A830D619_9LAMI|nr:hypothetical protein PHJA_002816000 [Phtheirospermum japonicum]